jgi:hypothetical protein
LSLTPSWKKGPWEPPRAQPVQPKRFSAGRRVIHAKRPGPRPRPGEEGLDKIIEGEPDKGREMIKKAKKIEPKAVKQLAEEIETDRATAERFVGRAR